MSYSTFKEKPGQQSALVSYTKNFLEKPTKCLKICSKFPREANKVLADFGRNFHKRS